MSENIIAAFVGGIVSAMRHTKRGWFKCFEVFITGFFLSYFIASDVVVFMENHFSVVVSYGAMYFVVAYLGSSLLSRATDIVSVWKLPKWKYFLTFVRTIDMRTTSTTF